jgi:hypothetical protein
MPRQTGLRNRVEKLETCEKKYAGNDKTAFEAFAKLFSKYS